MNSFCHSISRHLAWKAFATAFLAALPLSPLSAAPTINQPEPLQLASSSENPFSRTVQRDGAKIQHPPAKIAIPKSRRVTVAIKRDHQCYLGDINLMIVDTGWARTDKVRVSIESLDPQNPFVSSVEVPVMRFREKDFNLTLSVPPASTTTPTGLFICKDVENSGRCLDKMVMTSKELFKFYDPDLPLAERDPKRDIVDKSYFFGSFVTYGDRLEVHQGNYDSAAEQSLRESISSLPADRADAAVKKATHMHHTLGSLPLSTAKGAVVATLPGFDPSTCAPQQETSP